MFMGVYFSITVLSIEPYYFKGLLFAIPFIFFGIITFLTATEKIKIGASYTNIVILAGFDFLDYRELPEGFTIYLIDSKTYEKNNWNHG